MPRNLITWQSGTITKKADSSLGVVIRCRGYQSFFWKITSLQTISWLKKYIFYSHMSDVTLVKAFDIRNVVLQDVCWVLFHI